jgi:uncharacterized protein (TIGR03437 family)
MPAEFESILSGVAIDGAGNVYIAEGCRIREVTGGIINTVALVGTLSGQVCSSSPQRITVDSTGTLYFTDSGHGVRKLSQGQITLIAGGGSASPADGGPGTAADLYNLGGLTVDSGGKLYFTEGSSIRALSPSYSLPVPSIVFGGVRNGASFAPAPVAPGSIAAVFGSFGFGSAAQEGGTPLPNTLSGVSLQFQVGNGIFAPLFYASPQAGQVNFQVPWELAGQSTVPLRAVLNGSVSASQTLALATFAPGIFSVGPTQGAIVDSSNRLVDSTNPSTTGSFLQIYCTGLGPVMNPPKSGTAASITTLSQTTTKPTVTIGGVSATVLFSGLAPGTVGEYQLNVQVPPGIASGNLVFVTLSIGGATSNTVTIAASFRPRLVKYYAAKWVPRTVFHRMIGTAVIHGYTPVRLAS